MSVRIWLGALMYKNKEEREKKFKQAIGQIEDIALKTVLEVLNHKLNEMLNEIYKQQGE